MLSERAWSTYQRAIFDDAATGRGHTVVIARAGSGKTSTIVEALGRMPRGGRSLLLAFNASIERELIQRAPAGVEVQTLHKYGLSLLRQAFGRVDVDAEKLRRLVRELRIPVEPKGWSTFKRAVSMAKATMAETPEDVFNLIDRFGFEVEEGEAEALAGCVLRALQGAADNPRSVDFDDMVWLPLRLGLRPRGLDRVVVDEAQDLNRSQIELALRACRPGGRILAVGDDRQAIYGWRGADPRAIPGMVERLGARVLPLSVCYRCPRAVIEEAQRYVHDIEAAPGAEEGLVEEATESDLIRRAQPGDFIVSRVNGPLVELALELILRGKRAAITGRDFGQGLASFVERAEATTVEGLLEWVDAWEGEEVKRLLERDRDPSEARDRAMCVRRVAHGAGSLGQVLDRIGRLFDDGGTGPRITLSSTHRAKGLEADRVWMLADTYRSFTRPGGSVEEDNLAYVATTRARRELRLVRWVSK